MLFATAGDRSAVPSRELLTELAMVQLTHKRASVNGVSLYYVTGNEPVVVLITGTGPTDTVYENAADNATRKP
jgi:hypothetical protein